MGKKPDHTGKRFGRWTVIKEEPARGSNSMWLCRCDCGKTKIIYGCNLVGGKSSSCGCYLKDVVSITSKIHGKRKTTEYNVWASMVQRCTNEKHQDYADYGFRGITVCERWKKFENFFADMGVRPKDTSIDRIDNDLGYSPENCRWATKLQQSLNRQKTVKVKYKGEVIPVYYVCKELGIHNKNLTDSARRSGGSYVIALRKLGVECEDP